MPRSRHDGLLVQDDLARREIARCDHDAPLLARATSSRADEAWPQPGVEKVLTQGSSVEHQGLVWQGTLTGSCPIFQAAGPSPFFSFAPGPGFPTTSPAPASFALPRRAFPSFFFFLRAGLGSSAAL